MRVLAALACALCAPAGALLASRASAAEPPPATAGVAPQPQISFTLDVPPPISSWNAVARKAASLQQVECAADLLEKTAQIVDEAEAGDSLAMAALGTMYLFGQACAPKRNLTWGLHWLTRAEELDQPDAQAVMGFLHASDALRDVYNFTGFAANRTHARVLYERAALGGSVYGSMALGYRYGHGIGAVESCASSAAWYERAAEGAVSTLADERAHTVENSNPVEQDHLTLLSKKLPKRDGRMERSAVEYMDYCAHIGDRAGKVGMGHLYHTGAHGVPRDRAAAKHWFRSAARSGDAMGHANLGLMELRDRRFGHALKSLRRATKQNDPSGWAGLGFAFLYGAGVPQSDERAAQCLALAARMGHLDSIYNLGVLTLAGRGVPQNTRAGFRLLSVAAEFSHPTAQWHVGRMARSGLGVLKDCNTAQFFLKHAAEQGPLARSLMMTALTAYEAERPQRALLHYLLAAHIGVEAAQHNAGHIYAHVLPGQRGRGSATDRATLASRASHYFKLAALQGSVDAQVQLANLLVSEGSHETAARLYREAARAGSKDAVFHLGWLFWRGQGVARKDKRTAWMLWQEAGFTSKHAEQRGLRKLGFGVARFVLQYRALLLLSAGLGAVVATGGNPLDIVRNAMGGGVGGQPAESEVWQGEGESWEYSEEDLFADDAEWEE